MIRKSAAVLLLLLLLTGEAGANADISFTSGITQQAFKSFVREAGAALCYKNTASPEPLGLTGFDLAAEVTAVDIRKEADYWKAATGNDAPSYLLIPKLRARKGLPFSTDVGAMYAKAPDSNIQLYGAEVSKALLDGTAATPALGLRATYTRLSGVGELDLQTVGFDASLSKGFLIFKPYIGAGAIWIDAKARGNLQTLSTALTGAPLKEERFWQERVFGGIKITPIPFFSVTAEAEYSGIPTYSLKAAFGF